MRDRRCAMVTILKDRFIIEVECGTAAHEDYVDTMNGIVECIQAQSDDFLDRNYDLLELLRQMLPNKEQARSMVSDDVTDQLSEHHIGMKLRKV